MSKPEIVDVNKLDSGLVVEFSDGSVYQFDPEFLYRQRDKRVEVEPQQD